MAGPVVTYVGHKARRIRWQPQGPGSIGGSTYFATGSYDDEENRVCLWCYNPLDQQDADTDRIVEPEVQSECDVGACDVQDLVWVDGERVAASLSSGDLLLLQMCEGPTCPQLVEADQWRGIHHGPGNQSSPASCLTVPSSSAIISGGEDGRLCVVQPGSSQPVMTVENADCSCVTALLTISHTTVLASSSGGLLKLWDFRTPATSPSRVISVSGELLVSHSMSRHPNQPHLVAAGCDNGAVRFWDLRNEKQPLLSITTAHEEDVSDIHFHKERPDHLFTCSEDGSLWHWDGSQSSTKLWLSTSTNRGQIDICNLLSSNRSPVNSFDIEPSASHMVAVTDGGTFFVMPNLIVR